MAIIINGKTVSEYSSDSSIDETQIESNVESSIITNLEETGLYLNNSRGNYSVNLGLNAGVSDQGDYSIALGRSAGQTSQNSSCISIGNSAGNITQGAYSIALGFQAGQTNQPDYSVAIGYNSNPENKGDINISTNNYSISVTSNGLLVNNVEYINKNNLNSAVSLILPETDYQYLDGSEPDTLIESSDLNAVSTSSILAFNNPYNGRVICEAEVYDVNSGLWISTGWLYSGAGQGVKAGVYDGDIMLVTGDYALAQSTPYSAGGIHAQLDEDITSSSPCRIWVYQKIF